MDNFNRVIDKMMDELTALAARDDSIQEYMSDVYGAFWEDTPEFCIVDYIVTYFDAVEDFVDIHH